MNILYAIAAVLILSVIVMVHELGHFLVGRLTGMAVEEFSIGMGPKILSHAGKHTVFSLRLIPLGGYCRFRGEDETSDAPDAMNNQPVWKRFLTVAAGPLMNFLFAYLVCVAVLTGYVYRETLPQVAQLVSESPAAQAGLIPGDIITSINSVSVSFDGAGAQQLQETVQAADLSHPLAFTVNRNGEVLEFFIVPAAVELDTGETAYQIGIAMGGRTFRLGEALAEGTGFMADMTREMLLALKNLFFRGEGLEDTMGPVGIISFVSQSIGEGLYTVLWLMFVISLNLGIMNLLPLPALDGGRLVFLAIEGIRRKPIPRNREGLVHGAGFVILLLAILFFTYQDIMRLIAD